MIDDDLKFLWAAYRKGTFQLEEDLTQGMFKDALANHLAAFNAIYILLARVQDGQRPVGLVACHDQGYRLEPHVIWFPWASDRNKLESTLNFCNKIRVTRVMILFAPQKDTPFFEHVSRYGVLQRRGTISRFFEDGQFAAIFQTRD